ncbi:hypothetical protein MNBD_ALPHA06-803, partial [hydrothermal vent metagenome]
MKQSFFATTALAILMFGAAPASAQDIAGTDAEAVNQALLERIQKLEAELGSLRDLVQQSVAASKTAQQAADTAEKTATTAQKTASTAQRQVAKAAAGAYSGAASDNKWHLAGYADVGFVGSNDASSDSFVTGKFNPGFHFQYKDLFIFESELEFSTSNDGETGVELEYSQFDIFLNDYATLVVGKYLSPIGQFQERLHPSWINKIQGAPAGFGHDGVQPAGDTGVQLRGTVPVGKSRLAYAFMLGNGPRTNNEGAVDTEAVGRDDNSNKSFGGRIGFFPVPYLEIGGSYLNSKVNGYDTPTGAVPLAPTGPTDAKYELWGFDAAYTKGSITARFEYLNSQRDILFTATDEDPGGALLPVLGMEAWYGQLSYRLSKFGDSAVLQKMEPVIRYGEF